MTNLTLSELKLLYVQCIELQMKTDILAPSYKAIDYTLENLDVEFARRGFLGSEINLGKSNIFSVEDYRKYFGEIIS